MMIVDVHDYYYDKALFHGAPINILFGKLSIGDEFAVRDIFKNNAFKAIVQSIKPAIFNMQIVDSYKIIYLYGKKIDGTL